MEQRADETGSFTFAHRPAGHYRLTANTGAGNAKLEFELGENEIKEGILLQVGAGHAVRGVIKGFRPEQLEQTFVTVQPESKGSGNFSAKPDEQGAYVVRGVSPGRVLVTAYADSREKSRTIDVPADQDVVLDIVFPPGVRLSGPGRRAQSPLPAGTSGSVRPRARQTPGIKRGLHKMAATKWKECRLGRTASVSAKMPAASSRFQATQS